MFEVESVSEGSLRSRSDRLGL